MVCIIEAHYCTTTGTGGRRDVAEGLRDKILTELSAPAPSRVSDHVSEMSTVRYRFMEKLGYETILALCRVKLPSALCSTTIDWRFGDLATK